MISFVTFTITVSVLTAVFQVNLDFLLHLFWNRTLDRELVQVAANSVKTLMV